jgi:hypothetical protein
MNGRSPKGYRRRSGQAGAGDLHGPDHIPIELWCILIVSPPVVVFADEIGMVGFPGQRFRRRAGGGVSVGGADGTSGHRQGVPLGRPRPSFLVYADKLRFLLSEIENGPGSIYQ